MFHCVCPWRWPILVLGFLTVALSGPPLLPDFGPSRANAASPHDPDIQDAVARAVEYLKMQKGGTSGERSLVAMTLLKAGVPAENPEIQKRLNAILAGFKRGKYSESINNYRPSVSLMALLAADPKLYEKEIGAIINFLVSHQGAGGEWDYLNSVPGYGDTSQSQFVLLALWSASEAGFSIPRETWAKAGQWHLATQYADGAFSYHPLGGSSNFGPTHAMTVAGGASLAISFRHLYPKQRIGSRESAEQRKRRKQRAAKKKMLHGVMEEVNSDPPDPDKANTSDEATDEASDDATDEEVSTAGAGRYRRAIGMARNWMANGQQNRMRFTGISRFPLYYMYGLERFATLIDAGKIGGHDWYTEGANFLLKEQKPDGSWLVRGPQGVGSRVVPSTCFAVLFLIRATGKMTGRIPRVENLGSGILIGTRGLPNNLNHPEIDSSTGRAKVAKKIGPIEDLVGALANLDIDSINIEAVQAGLIDVVLGEPEKLIGQKDRLVKLVKSPHFEVRRTALWALARSEDLRMAKLMVEALDEDPHLSVAVEARNALCTLSRKPLGFGHSGNPLKGMRPNADKQQKKAAIEKWRAAAVQDWTKWYLSVRPYDERDDLFELGRR